DAAEGVLPGTRFVLKKALELNLRPMVLINKIDRPDAEIEKTESSIHDLFLDYATKDEQLDFPILYGSSKLGFVGDVPTVNSGDMSLALDTIIKNVPAPQSKADHLQFLVTSLDHSDFLGLVAIGRVFSGTISVGQDVICCKDDKVSKPTRITKIYTFEGLQRKEVQSASAGDIIAITGFNEPVTIGTTICEVDHALPYPYVKVDEPTLSIFMSVNDSPFSGREGSLLTSRQIKERLEKELKTNVALRVEPTDSPETFKLSGRGQLHLGILFENMRREGFEFQLSAPEVIFKTIDGQKCEPVEYVILEVNSEHQGVVMEKLGPKRAELKHMEPLKNNRLRMEFEVPSRGLLGFRSQFLTDTRGTGIFNTQFHGYKPFKGEMTARNKGAIISMEAGTTTGYALNNVQERGVLFVAPGQAVYEGLIIGENSRDEDMVVNPCKGKKLTNMRASGTDDAIKLEPPRVMELERCMEWISPDELIEVTPQTIRLRKKVLRASLRK
ncbi:MAG: EF-Tu/IF-2/RF-3 family GTPase, partial [Candidatus Babeliales bacterium]